MKDRQFRYKFLDIVRLYCAMQVILIHMGLGDGTAVISCLTRQAVPFFFLASGFFFAKKAAAQEQLDRFALSYVGRILAVYFAWILLWLPSTIIKYSHLYPQSLPYLAAVLFRRLFIAGIAPYWYLLVLAEGALLLALFLKRKWMLPGALLCAAGLVLSVIYAVQAEGNQNGLVYRVFYTVFSWNCNVIMAGFPMLFLGALAARYETRLRALSFRFPLLLYATAVISAFVLFSRRGTLFSIPFGPIQALFLFLACVSDAPFQNRLPDRLCAFTRNLSSVVFLTHTVFLSVLGNVLHIWGLAARYLLTLACATLLMLTARKLNWKPLNGLLMVKRWD